MAEKARFWAGKAVSVDQIAVSYGLLSDEDPLSVIVLFKKGGSVEWGYVDIPRTIVSITFQSAPSGDRPIFVAMSNEGDVYRIEGDIPHEKIPGAGVLSPDALGYGSMRTIEAVSDGLVAVGKGSQVYVRDSAGVWRPFPEPASRRPPLLDFVSVAQRSPGALVLAGATQLTYRQPTEEEEKTLARFRAEGPNSRFMKYRREIMRVERYVEASLSTVTVNSLVAFELSSPHPLNAVVNLGSRGVVAAGEAGTILQIDSNDDIVDISIEGVTETFRTLRQIGDTLWLLGQTCIYVLTRDFQFKESISLPAEMKFPFSMDVGPDWIVLFDHDGVAIRQDGNWGTVEIPKAILERARPA